MAIRYSYWFETFGYKFSLLPKIALALPQWHETEPFPPLSPRIAIANSEVAVQRILAPDTYHFEPNFSSCALQFTHGSEGSWWFYMVDWFVPGPEGDEDWSTFSVPVLFDGSTPEPQKFHYEDRFLVYQWE